MNEVDELKVTVVGKDIFKEVISIFEEVGLRDLESANKVKEIKTGSLGNLNTLTYIFEIPTSKVIDIRKALMVMLTENSSRLMPMYVHGDWMRIFVFKTIKT